MVDAKTDRLSLALTRFGPHNGVLGSENEVLGEQFAFGVWLPGG